MSKGTAEQRKAWNRTYYLKNKEKRLAQYGAYKKELRAWFQTYKSTLSCSRCGFNHPAALHFHHREPDSKEGTIAEMVGQGWSKARVIAEIDKCDILCANCHAIEHYEERNNV